ncbi:hypothetical protein NL676_007371 [Syzygium grande]|nr:hypothetical protein NL676_007371 [Syzygium grande]
MAAASAPASRATAANTLLERSFISSRPLQSSQLSAAATIPRAKKSLGALRVKCSAAAAAAAARECKVKSVRARQIVDSRGNPTVEVDLVTDDLYRSAVARGRPPGFTRNINEVLGPKLVGVDVRNHTDVDAIMLEIDSTPNKSTMGANAILGVSLSPCRAGVGAKRVPLYKHIQEISGTKELVMPVPAFNVINGGSHAGNNLAMQEFMILPVGATSFTEALRMGSEVYHVLKGIIKAKYGQDACNVGDEGGFTPNVQDNREELVLLMDAIEKAVYTGKIKIGMYVAASEFFLKDGRYDLISRNNQMMGLMCSQRRAFRIAEAIGKKACNAFLLKVNQIGIVTESIQVALDLKAAGWGVMVSHRCGETEDNFIADLFVGLVSKQLLRIEEEVGNIRYAGEAFRSP